MFVRRLALHELDVAQINGPPGAPMNARLLADEVVDVVTSTVAKKGGVMSEDAFGFKRLKPNTADKLKTIQPHTLPTIPAPIAKVDAAREARGFPSRERVERGGYWRKREIGPPIATTNTRVPECVAAPSIQFCETNRFSYWEGIEKLTQRVDLVR